MATEGISGSNEEQAALVLGELSNKLLAATGGPLVSNQVLVVTPIIDDSSSIKTYGNTDSIIHGHNGYMANMRQAIGNILMGVRYLNGEWLYTHRSPAHAIQMNHSNYTPWHGTPLYDQGVTSLQEILAIAKQLGLDGKDVYTMSIFFSDGCDEHSHIHGPSNVKEIVDAMFATRKNIVGAVAVRDGKTDFHSVFASMGIPEQWIDVIERSDAAIQESFGTVSSRASDASMSQADFTWTSETGFGRRPRNGGTKK